MLLSPFSHRPASARPYRRNKLNQNQQQQPQQSKTQEEIKQRRNVQSLRAARRSEPFILANCEDLADDDFKWTDVDGFYGRKNSIPLHQLLANDLALLRGIHAKNGWKYKIIFFYKKSFFRKTFCKLSRISFLKTH